MTSNVISLKLGAWGRFMALALPHPLRIQYLSHIKIPWLSHDGANKMPCLSWDFYMGLSRRLPIFIRFYPMIHWIGLRENLNRKPSIFPLRSWCFPVKFPLNQSIEWWSHYYPIGIPCLSHDPIVDPTILRAGRRACRARVPDAAGTGAGPTTRRAGAAAAWWQIPDSAGYDHISCIYIIIYI